MLNVHHVRNVSLTTHLINRLIIILTRRQKNTYRDEASAALFEKELLKPKSYVNTILQPLISVYLESLIICR